MSALRVNFWWDLLAVLECQRNEAEEVASEEGKNGIRCEGGIVNTEAFTYDHLVHGLRSAHDFC
jgi:hypothetical protein